MIFQSELIDLIILHLETALGVLIVSTTGYQELIHGLIPIAQPGQGSKTAHKSHFQPFSAKPNACVEHYNLRAVYY